MLNNFRFLRLVFCTLVYLVSQLTVPYLTSYYHPVDDPHVVRTQYYMRLHPVDDPHTRTQYYMRLDQHPGLEDFNTIISLALSFAIITEVLFTICSMFERRYNRGMRRISPIDEQELQTESGTSQGTLPEIPVSHSETPRQQERAGPSSQDSMDHGTYRSLSPDHESVCEVQEEQPVAIGATRNETRRATRAGYSWKCAIK